MSFKVLLLRFAAVLSLSAAVLVTFDDVAFAGQKCPFDLCTENCHVTFDACKQNQAGTVDPLQECVWEWRRCKNRCALDHDRDDARCENVTVPKTSIWDKFKALINGCTDWLWD